MGNLLLLLMQPSFIQSVSLIHISYLNDLATVYNNQLFSSNLNTVALWWQSALGRAVKVKFHYPFIYKSKLKSQRIA